MKIKSNKAQAMTEFVIVIPVFILLLIGMLQLTAICMKKIQLAMLEREVMIQLLRDSGSEKAEQYGKKLGEQMGLNKEKISLSINENDNAVSGLDWLASLGCVRSLTGVTFKISYRQEVMKTLSKIMGKEELCLKTGLNTAAGGTWKVDPDFFKKLKEEPQ